MKKRLLSYIVVVIILLISFACTLPGTGNNNQDTPTMEIISPTATNTTVSPAVSNQCEGFSGELEVFVMAGPGAAVGLEPFAIGNFPISASLQDGIYQVTGGGPADYYDLYSADWGTYEVTMDLDISIEGACDPTGDPGKLDLTVTMSGSQNVVVESPGLSGEYPWNGTNSVNMVLPINEGASAAGEGWQCILHPNS